MPDRDAVLAAAQRHLREHPTASMADLAAAAGISRATLHRVVPTRDELTLEIGRRAADRWAESQRAAGMPEATASDDPVLIRTCLDDMLARFVADLDDFGFALTDAPTLAHPDLRPHNLRLFDAEVAFYAAAQRAGVLRDDVSAVWLCHAVYGLLVAVRTAHDEGDVARRDLTRLVVTTFDHGASR